MAEVLCPNCGKSNPDFLDNCQFCQTSLKPETTVHTGENPVKKNTGELEPILPEWLKDMRQQGRESAAQEAEEEAAKPKVQKNEPPDLLAGLASQGRSDDEEVPDWLASINPTAKPAAAESPEPESDFFAQFRESAPAPVESQASEPVQEDMPSWMTGVVDAQPAQPAQAAEEKDELSEWFAKASEEPSAPVEMESELTDWTMPSEAPSYAFKEPPPQPKADEDLGWLHSLEDSSKEEAKPAAQPESQSDLSWLDDLSNATADVPPGRPATDEPPTWVKKMGGVEAPQSAEPVNDLSWLNQSAPEKETPAETPNEKPAIQSEPTGDLSWLNDFSNATAEVPPGRPATDEPPSWVKNMGGTETTPQPAEPADDLSWLNQPAPEKETPADAAPVWLQDQAESQAAETPSESDKVSPFTRRTGPLRDVIDDDSIPDWLKSATEEPSMPAPGALADWFRDSDRSPQPSLAADSDASKVSPPSKADDVDLLLSADMPAWLTQSEPAAEEAPPITPGIFSTDSLAPGELPSWVKDMRPSDSALPVESPRRDQYTEGAGPLAGLEGIIPLAPIGSSRRPKMVSLKLQPTDEQVAGATLLEQILASETTPQPLASQTNVTSQRVLRWVLSALFFIVLSVTAFTRTNSMPISAALPPEVQSISSAISRLPQNPLVLVVMDYEPALSGEMEAVSGPLLDQLTSQTIRARLVFVSTSPNSTALVRRLLTNTGILLPTPAGQNYQMGENFTNLGYLPGGYTGVREFLESPTTTLPLAGQPGNFTVSKFTDYSAVVVLTDHAESGRVWVEQLYARNRSDATFFAVQPVFFAASAQAAPMLLPYYSSQQITGMVSGLPDAARYEFVNNTRPGIARRYWDSFGAGLLTATAAIVLGSLWSLVAALRARRSGEAG